MCLWFKPKCLKFFIFVACILILALGAILVWVGYRVLNEEFVKSLDYEYVGIIVICCGSVLLLISFIGLLGSCYKKKLPLGIFIVFAFIIGILLIAFGAVLIYSRNISDDYLSSESECLDNYEDAEAACEYSEQILCKVYCPCEADNEYVLSLAEESQNKSINEVYYVYSDQGAENILDCDPCYELEKTDDPFIAANITAWIKEYLGEDATKDQCKVTTDDIKDKYFDEDMRKYLPLLKWVEESFDCSGMCTAREIYLFSDVDNGEPDGSCRKELNDWVQETFLAFGVVSIIFGIYIVFVTFFSCCFFRHAGVDDASSQGGKAGSKSDRDDKDSHYDIISSDRT